jgi:hypothetical protein
MKLRLILWSYDSFYFFSRDRGLFEFFASMCKYIRPKEKKNESVIKSYIVSRSHIVKHLCWKKRGIPIHFFRYYAKPLLKTICVRSNEILHM